MSVQFKQILVNEGLGDWKIRSGEAYCYSEQKSIAIPGNASLPLFLHEVAHALHPQPEGELKNHYHGGGWAQIYGELINRYMAGKDAYDALLASHKRLVKESGELFKSHCLNQHSVSKLCPICVDFAEALRLARELEGA